MTGFKVLQNGFGVTLQDSGRKGLQSFGVAESGPMDSKAFHWANRLLLNDANASMLEIPFGQFQLLSLVHSYGIVTGADLNFSINKQKQARYQVFEINPGDLLAWKQPSSGNRAYFAVKGGFNATERLNSQATTLRENLGKAIEKGQTLSCDTCDKSHQAFPIMLPDFFPDYRAKQITLRFTPCFQWLDFAASQQRAFLSQSFTISNEHNRTGCRLKAAIKIEVPYQNMISEGMPIGSIQIPPSGDPIVMLNEHPTIGGYPKVGQVSTLDLGLLNQAHVGTKVRFEIVDIEKLQKERLVFESFFAKAQDKPV